ncbi:hypothetical protein AZE42_08323 [Rhizopogon vesiculosus]|uniref:Uncharacterized protein n=1 Tax=Rhizopogon vesiculosus TaxID=180088 RepID=A0A1J8Q7J1_9AGAM|nr:hypothetical protein AZE42_08323 [Rhizopogon vesiculosus]
MTNDLASSSEVSGPNKTTTHSPREILEANLFIDVDFLLTNIVIATKSPDGLIDWIELRPEFHSSLVKCALRLISKHTAAFKTASAKEALFPFLINLLNGRVTCTALVHKTKTVTISKRANKERKHVDTEKLKVNVNDAEAKKTPPVRAPSLGEVVHPPPDPAIMTVTSGPDSKAPEKKASPTSIIHPLADSEVIPQAQDTGPVVDEPEAEESSCPGIHTHPACDVCHRLPAAGVKHNRYPKCTTHRLGRDGRFYAYGYTDYSCNCAEDYWINDDIP